jgi:predicted NUDIX family NTP pyrophosphohydrolase
LQAGESESSEGGRRLARREVGEEVGLKSHVGYGEFGEEGKDDGRIGEGKVDLRDDEMTER